MRRVLETRIKRASKQVYHLNGSKSPKIPVKSSSPSFSEGATFATTGAFVDDLTTNNLKMCLNYLKLTFSWGSFVAFLAPVSVLVPVSVFLPQLVLASTQALASPPELRVVWRKHIWRNRDLEKAFGK